MSRSKLCKDQVMRELIRATKPISGVRLVESVLHALTPVSIEPIGKNMVQQVISALKKDGMIDYTPSSDPTKPHTLQASKKGQRYFLDKPAEPVKPKPTPKQEDKPMETNIAQNTFYKVIDLENGEIAGQCKEYTEAQDMASKHVIATQHRVKIESVSVIVMAEYEPVITARYKPAA